MNLLIKFSKVDDPVGAVGVHGLNGAFGTLAVGLFSDGAGTEWKGLLTGGGFHGFGVQFIGMAITIAWVTVTMTIIFQVDQTHHRSSCFRCGRDRRSGYERAWPRKCIRWILLYRIP